MPSIAFHTLGCKVNQYDTQAMLELFSDAGWEIVPFSGNADVYVLNTCTVTGTGDKKSLQLARHLKRIHPASKLILCGCLAQKKGDALLDTGADLILGTKRRGDVVSLLEQVLSDGIPRCAVEPFSENEPFESLCISSQTEHTRATLKIQEGCNNHCTYCIIPSVRGPIRSRLPEDISAETERLIRAGFTEIVITGIHLASYGKDLPGRSLSLTDAINAVQQIHGVRRIRLGSLEPVAATDAFADFLARIPQICPQFHLALQSGSDAVLARMKRRYNTRQYLESVDRLRLRFPDAAFTTDILTGFPGETEKEFEETAAMIERVGYARIHVFPYSPREDTPAASMPDQLTAAEKEDRARKLIALGNRVSHRYLEKWIGRDVEIIPEEKINGCWEGYTPEYIRVTLHPEAVCRNGQPVCVRLESLTSRGMRGIILDKGV